MRLICYWWQRQLARYVVFEEAIPPESALTRHLDACADCAQAYQDFARLRTCLPDALSAPTLSPDFGARLRTRLQPALQSGSSASSARSASAVPRSLRWGLAGAGMGILTLGGLSLLQRAQEAGKGAIVNTVAIPTSTNRASLEAIHTGSPAHSDATAATIRMAIGHRAESVSVRRLPRRTDIVWAEPFRGHRLIWSLRRQRSGFETEARDIVAKNQRKVPNRPTKRLLPEIQQTVIASALPTWTELGAAYEACGDYSRASHAYGCAFAGHQDADLALAASENAERAGDTSQALEYYARALAEKTDKNTNIDQSTGKKGKSE